MSSLSLPDYIRVEPGFPKPEIKFLDITLLLSNPEAYAQAVGEMIEPFAVNNISRVAAIEARGFCFGGPIATKLGVGLVLVRKAGKLPGATFDQPYNSEYGSEVLQIQRDALQPNNKVLVVDDVLATGGTAEAAIRLAGQAGANVVGFSCLIELDIPGKNGRQRIEDLGVTVHSLMAFDERTL